MIFMAKEKEVVEKKDSTKINAAGIPLNLGAVILEPGSTKKYKTGEWRTFIPMIDSTKCIKCGQCWMTCPDAAIFKAEDGSFRINYTYCKGCLLCEKVCPVKCISHKVEEK